MKLFNGKLKIWDRFVISNRMRGDESAYITRLRIIDTPLFGVFVHDIHRPDAQPMHHDHPWVFIAVVLRGGYVESIIDPRTREVRDRRIRRINVKGLADAHYIKSVEPGTRSLVFVGRTRRMWGYQERVNADSGHRFTPWSEHPVHAWLERR